MLAGGMSPFRGCEEGGKVTCQGMPAGSFRRFLVLHLCSILMASGSLPPYSGVKAALLIT